MPKPDRDQRRRAILAIARPGRLLPRQRDIAKILGCHQPQVATELDALREERRIVTKLVYVYPSREKQQRPQRRLMVVEASPSREDARAAGRVATPSPQPAVASSTGREMACHERGRL